MLRNEHVFPFDQGTAILLPEGILFATYATPRTDERGERLSRVRQIIAWLVPHFARVSALDESHAMQKAEGLKGDRGELKAWAESIVVTERRTIYAHSACGTETRWLTVTIRDRLRSLGVFAELISCRLRMLVPVDTRGDEVLARLLARFPLTGVSDREAA
ncbi:strawberry notch family protein (plasmid) [Bradyrhizobium sp. 62B]|nr:strawberry notch family protein [Bradyrhizobium sp. 62B]